MNNQYTNLATVLLTVLLLNFMNEPQNLAHGQQTYRLPPQEVVEIIDAQPVPAISMSPNREWMLLMERPAMPSIEDMSRRMLRLAGMRIDPSANSPFSTSFYTGISLRALQGDEEIKVVMPPNVKISEVAWSHQSDRFAFSTVTDEGQQLWTATVDAPSRPIMLTDRLSTVMGSFDWMPDGKSILCQLVPEDRAGEPIADLRPVGPNIQESSGNKSPTRTYQDLLTNSHDEALFEYYATNQLAVSNAAGNVQPIGKPGIIGGAVASPNGKHILVTRIQKPFSYLMTMRSFPKTIEVWNRNGDKEFLVADVPMEENIPIEGVRTGPRSVDWKSGEPATLVWTEALDGGDPNVEAEYRDRMVALAAPFEGEPYELLKTEQRAFGMSVMDDPSVVVVTDYDRDRRWVRTAMHDLKQPGTTPVTLMDRSIRDRYNDPGRVVMTPDETGHVRALQDGDWFYRLGAGASAKGNLPFIDRQNIKTQETERLWRCEEGAYESVVA
ncbi:MAG: hypothetical protein P8J33_16585, partial [Pirellulaceae bacterium]|nr:hypothetical protein [Pirellulaceae bacterium]